MIPIDWLVVGPATILVGGAVVALLIDAFYPQRAWLASGIPSLVAVVAGGAELLRTGGPDDLIFGWSLVILGGILLVVLAANVMNFEMAMPAGEFHFLVLSSAAGALMLVAARDLVTLVVSLELLALPSIALVGLRQGDKRAIRSAWTFFLASVVSTAITLMGISLLYGATGTLEYGALREGLATTDVPDSVVAVAVVLTLVGLLFKLGAVPFHAWIPDTYRGSSVLVAGYLSTVSKAAALGSILFLLAVALPDVEQMWQPLVAMVAAMTMTIGNVGALRQRDGVGLLAWSSIAQAGFLLAPAAALLTAQGLSAPLQYVAVYVVANLVAFTALAVVMRLRGSTSFDDLRGLARTDPWTGVPLAFSALALAGFPPAVIGLVTKYVVIRPVVDGGEIWLAVVMAINVMIGLAYYLRLVVVLVDRPVGEPYVSPSPPVSVRVAKAVVLVGTAALLITSVWPSLVLSHLP